MKTFEGFFKKIKKFFCSFPKHVYLPLILFVVLIGGKVLDQPSHTKNGTYYGEEAIKIYQSSKSYPYISNFLLPNFLPELQKKEKILDAGCGVGLWALYAAKKGAEVWGIDLQEGMIEEAKKNSEETNVSDRTHFIIGDVAKLPYSDGFFDKSISINVACNLPQKSLDKHFRELARVTKTGGRIIFVVPISHGEVFTDGLRPKTEVLQNINQILNELKKNPDTNEIIKSLEKIQGVYSATFALRKEKLVLVLDEKDLVEGEKIWRKLPNIVIPNRYYSEKIFEDQIQKSNLQIEKIMHPQFFSEKERLDYNSKVSDSNKLGPEYTQKSTFLIYFLKK